MEPMSYFTDDRLREDVLMKIRRGAIAALTTLFGLGGFAANAVAAPTTLNALGSPGTLSGTDSIPLCQGCGPGINLLNAPLSALLGYVNTNATFALANATGTLAVNKGGTNSISPSATALDNITGFAGLGFVQRTGPGAYTFVAPGAGVVSFLGGPVAAVDRKSVV